jgi:putative resolvase
VEGKMIPERTVSGHRRYDLTKLQPEIFHEGVTAGLTIAYARVSSYDQYGSRSRKNKKLLEDVKKAVEESGRC